VVHDEGEEKSEKVESSEGGSGEEDKPPGAWLSALQALVTAFTAYQLTVMESSQHQVSKNKRIMERQCRYIFLRAETAFYVIVGVKNPLNKN
jgi:hypothetical protein